LNNNLTQKRLGSPQGKKEKAFNFKEHANIKPCFTSPRALILQLKRKPYLSRFCKNQYKVGIVSNVQYIKTETIG